MPSTKSTARRKSSTRDSKGSTRGDRPRKPYATFPLTPHPLGKWQKKINGRIVYFGRWGRVVDGKMERVPGDGWEEALALYKAQADDLHAGRTPAPRSTAPDAVTVAELCNEFLSSKLRKLEAGRIVQRTFDELKETTDRIVERFGARRAVASLRPTDFAALRHYLESPSGTKRKWGPVRIANELVRIRSVFRYGAENDVCGAVKFGTEFDPPTAVEMEKHRESRPARMLEPADLRKLLDAADPTLRAMIYLGLNGGFGNHDLAMLPLSAVDLEKGVIAFPRPKTAVKRRCPLWGETVAALRDALAVMPKPSEPAAEPLVFRTARGRTFLSKGIAHPVSHRFGALLRRVGLHKPGLGFYTLRHVFRTIADETLDVPAVNRVMGHKSHSGIAARYVERIDDSRLRHVVDHVRAWLFGTEGGAA